jgi:hypothetical protein
MIPFPLMAIWIWFQSSKHHRIWLSYRTVDGVANAELPWLPVLFEGG